MALKNVCKFALRFPISNPLRQQCRNLMTIHRSVICNIFANVEGGQSHMYAEDARSVRSGKTEVNGNLLHFEITGTGRNAVLLLPGALGCSKTDFSRQMDTMNKELWTLIAWDPPGYGYSIPPERTWTTNYFERDANAAAELMENLGFGRYSLLGWSDGGVTAMMLAARHPERVEKLVVWGAGSYVTDEELKIYEKIRDIKNWSADMRASFLKVYKEPYLREQFGKWIDTAYKLKAEKGGDICRDDLAKIKCPTLIMHGEKDQIVPKFHPEFLAKNIKNASLKWFPDGKHNIHQRFHREFNSIVQHFLVSSTV